MKPRDEEFRPHPTQRAHYEGESKRIAEVGHFDAMQLESGHIEAVIVNGRAKKDQVYLNPRSVLQRVDYCDALTLRTSAIEAWNEKADSHR
jgi:hypothetical protein